MKALDRAAQRGVTRTVVPQAQTRLRLLGVFAHPDDETFCAGGTFARYVAAGAEVMVVCVTQGQSGQIRDAAAATRSTLGEVRKREFFRACAQLGVQHALCLDYVDGTLQDVDAEVLTAEVVRVIRSFRPDVVITFDAAGGYGHPDHIAVSAAATQAYRVAGDPGAFPDMLEQGLAPHRPARLYHSLFVRGSTFMLHEFARWLVGLGADYRGTDEFIWALSLFARESSTLQYTSDHVHVNWYPPGCYIIEQGEAGDSLYLILSGDVEVVREDENGTRHTVGRKGAGEFFGELALARQQPRSAHVIAAGGVTCLVLSATAPSSFAGRGSGARLTGSGASGSAEATPEPVATTCIDGAQQIDRKIAALTAHRTQYPILVDTFPPEMLIKMFGREYFRRVDPPMELETDLWPAPVGLDTASGEQHPRTPVMERRVVGGA